MTYYLILSDDNLLEAFTIEEEAERVYAEHQSLHSNLEPVAVTIPDEFDLDAKIPEYDFSLRDVQAVLSPDEHIKSYRLTAKEKKELNSLVRDVLGD